MRRVHRLALLATLLAISPVLAGCENFDLDKFDIFHLNDKKKLPGERKDVFPGGVPGVTQGVPPEYMKGYQAPPENNADALLPGSKVNPGDADAAAALKPEGKTAAIEPIEKPKPKPKRKLKPVTAQRAPTQITVRPAAQGQPASAQQQSPWPAAPGQAQQQQAQSPWPDPKQTTNSSPWPSAPPPGTFSR
jgi:hypothetical protein